MLRQTERRSPERMSDPTWDATLNRVRAEFEEMPCLRVTPAQAGALFGLPDPATIWVLSRLVCDGVLERTSDGAYLRRSAAP